MVLCLLRYTTKIHHDHDAAAAAAATTCWQWHQLDHMQIICTLVVPEKGP